MSKPATGIPSQAERAALVQFLISRGIPGSVAGELISSDRSRKENQDKIIQYIKSIKGAS